MMKKIINKKYDVVVVGGGMSGVCAAIASARHGAKTALIHNRPVLGGNASSEIRMHICGADCHGSRPDARETGILEEILLENKRRNPNHSFAIFDMVLWEKVNFQERLDLYLNTHLTDVVVKENIIKRVKAEQLTSERVYEFEGDIFVDTTGDGTLGFLAGAEYMMGREGKDVFGEQYAPDKSDHYTMGNTLMFKAIDTGKPVKFEKPSWANTYREEDLNFRDHTEITSGYWWVELGGGELSTITDAEQIRDELLKAVYGVWDHIKNGGDHGAEDYDLDWVQFLPGKRESRRFVGDYILKEQDCLEGRIFEDAVAYGGWPMDMHIMEGLKNKSLEPTIYIRLKDVYTIPYRSLYSKNINNLMIGGRAISASHMAMGSTRVMATCAVIGQAIGTASAMAIEKGIIPREVMSYIKELQQRLLKDDCHIPGFKNEDEEDLARHAFIACSSGIEGSSCENIINGYSRKVKDNTNCWISGEFNNKDEWISLEFRKTINPKEIYIRFDSNLSKEIMITLSKSHMNDQVEGLPIELVKDFRVEFYKKNELIHMINVKNNSVRNRILKIDNNIACDKIKICVESTYGDSHARIFEVRVY